MTYSSRDKLCSTGQYNLHIVKLRKFRHLQICQDQNPFYTFQTFNRTTHGLFGRYQWRGEGHYAPPPVLGRVHEKSNQWICLHSITPLTPIYTICQLQKYIKKIGYLLGIEPRSLPWESSMIPIILRQSYWLGFNSKCLLTFCYGCLAYFAVS